MKMKRMFVLTFLVSCLLSLVSISNAQTQSVNFSGPLKVGHETDGSQWVTEVAVINRTAEQKTISFNFFDGLGASFRVHRKRSDGFETETQGTTSSLLGNKNSISVISYIGNLTDGHIEFATSQTFVPALGKFVSDVEVQLVIKRVNSSGVTISIPTALAPNGGDTTNGASSNAIIQALISNTSQTGFSIYNPSTLPLIVDLKVYSLFSPGNNPYLVESVEIPSGQQMEENLSNLFIGIASNDGGGNPLTDATLEITSQTPMNMSAFRIDNGFRYEIPVFIGRSPTAQAVEVLTINKAKQKSGGKLIVYASSSQSHGQVRPTINLSITLVDGSVMDLGQMDYDEIAGIYYRLQKHFVPDSIVGAKVVSSGGGLATSTVK